MVSKMFYWRALTGLTVHQPYPELRCGFKFYNIEVRCSLLFSDTLAEEEKTGGFTLMGCSYYVSSSWCGVGSAVSDYDISWSYSL